MVVALIALAVALGGTSYAATQLPRNSVTTKQLKNNSVTSAKVKDRSLRSRDFAAGQLPAGERGPAGPTGPQGERGPAGSPDTSNFFTKSESDARFLASGGTAANSNQLEGLGSDEFVQGSGRRTFSNFLATPGNSTSEAIPVMGFIDMACNGGATAATVRIRAATGVNLGVITDDGVGGVTREFVTGGTQSLPVTYTPDGHVTWYVTVANERRQIDAWVAAAGTGCLADTVSDSAR